MTLPEAIVELRELRREQEARWNRDTASLQNLWSGMRFSTDARVGDMPKQAMSRRRLEALRIAEQVLIELDRGPRLDDQT